MYGIIFMNDKLKKILNYTGIFASIISAIAYLVITYVIVIGFESAVDMQKQILFSILGSFIGLMITFFLRNQGITFAQKEETSQKVMKEYFELINKNKPMKKLHTIKHFMVWSTIKDIFSKGISIAGTTYLVLYIFMEGNGDFSLFLLAVSNICMFAGFGFLAISKAYDKYMDEHIPVMKAIIIKLKEKTGQVGPIQPESVKENVNIQQCEIPITSTTSGEKQIGHLGDQRIN